MCLTRQFISIYIREPKTKSGNHFRRQKERYFKIYREIFTNGLIRGIKNSGLFIPICDALAAIRHTRLILSGMCGKTMHAVRKNCSRPKNIEIKSKKCKIKHTSQTILLTPNKNFRKLRPRSSHLSPILFFYTFFIFGYFGQLEYSHAAKKCTQCGSNKYAKPHPMNRTGKQDTI